jgi:hypothetical protein
LRSGRRERRRKKGTEMKREKEEHMKVLDGQPKRERHHTKTGEWAYSPSFLLNPSFICIWGRCDTYRYWIGQKKICYIIDHFKKICSIGHFVKIR